jgi:DMSO/TMAO reductase YedYZ molybdopterin-dependent catalytic subunit
MSRNCIFLKNLFVLILLLLPSVQAAEPENSKAIHVAGAIDKPSNWTVDRLKSELGSDMKKLHYSSHGQPHVSNSVPLLSLLKQCGAAVEMKMDPSADPQTKNRPVRLAIVVRGRDGYTATIGMAELLPDIGNREAWLALDMDGQPLAEKDGPVKLIIPSDLKPARWIHEIATITVVDGAVATTQPAK